MQKYNTRCRIDRMYSVLIGLLLLYTISLSSESLGGRENLQDTITAFYTSIAEADVEARIKLLADDVILMPNHWTIMEGKETVAVSYRNSSNAIFEIKEREILRLEISGNMAYTVNSYYYTYHAPGELEQWHKTKNVHIWHRDSSGQWKLAVDIWNSDVPLNLFENE